MKISKYISKYDFIGYYLKPKWAWFFSNSEIEAAIEVEYSKMKQSYSNVDFDEESNEDYLEKYKEIIYENQSVDKNNSLIIEGNIIDEKSKEYIKNLYDNKFKIIDLNKNFPKLNNELKAEKTLELINKYEKIILFQAVFISKINNVDIITRPDAIVIEKNQFHLYETKATSSVKKHHLLDVYFQAKLIESIPELKRKFNFNYHLCIVAYEIAKLNDCPLIDTSYCNIGKTTSFEFKEYAETFGIDKAIEYGQDIKMGMWTSKSANYDYFPFKIDSFVNHDFSQLKKRKDKAKRSQKSIDDFIEDALQIYSDFTIILAELKKYQETIKPDMMPIIRSPGRGDKSKWKDNDYFNYNREIYANYGYQLYSYSGTIFNQNYNTIISYQKNDNLIKFKKNEIAQYYLEKKNIIVFPEIKLFFNALKEKKVYFDFETINTAVRSYNDTFPFQQIVTQSSCIIDNGINKDFQCVNLLVDPIDINEKWFRDIIDSLYQGKNYSYVVYNQSFEKNRLEEMKTFISDLNYHEKINCIQQNMIDLADLFKFSKKNKNIFLKELKGFYSIKKVLPLIEKYLPDVFNLTKCFDYKKLKISNGKECQSATIKRFFKIIEDQEWKSLAHDLKVYCENDVRAMIAVEYFAKAIFNNQIKM
ncbi:MAG: DUF2779 domain-containing protein [Mycoplasmoidaceae bacterium]